MKKNKTLSPSPAMVVLPLRIRSIQKSGFAWVDARLHRDRWLEQMTATELAVYCFLCLVADRQGLSWYRRGVISETLAICETDLEYALARLCDFDLIAYRPFRRNASDGIYQVLSLPEQGPSEGMMDVDR